MDVLLVLVFTGKTPAVVQLIAHAAHVGARKLDCVGGPSGSDASSLVVLAMASGQPSDRVGSIDVPPANPVESSATAVATARLLRFFLALLFDLWVSSTGAPSGKAGGDNARLLHAASW